MKIDPKVLFPESRQPERVDATRQPPAQERAERTPAATEGARVSVDRERLPKLGVELTRLPDVRQDRIDAIQRALQDGTYRISEQKVAEKVFADFFGKGGPGE